MNCDLSVIVITYNGKKYLDALFASFAAVEDEGFTWEIVLVDNASSDGTADYVHAQLKTRFPNLRYVLSDKNRGFAGGNNLGAQHATGKYVLFLNNDTAVTPRFLRNMLRCIRETGAGIVNAKLVFYYDFIPVDIVPGQEGLEIASRMGINGTPWPVDAKFVKHVCHRGEALHIHKQGTLYVPLLQGSGRYTLIWEALAGDGVIHCAGREIPADAGTLTLTEEDCARHAVTLIQNAGTAINDEFNGYDVGFCEEDLGQYGEAREIEAACGAAMIMERDVFMRAGGFDDRFFMYYEDVDLSFRVKAMGYTLRYCPDAVVRHIHTGSSVEWSPFFMYYVYRNRLLFILKNFGIDTYRRERRKYVREVWAAWRTRRFRKPKTRALLSVLRLQWFYREGKR